MRYLSPILGVLTLKPNEIEEFRTDLQSFADKSDKRDREQQIETWIRGVRIRGAGRAGVAQTYYFLGEPVQFPRPLMKDGTIRKGRGKNWIACHIPKNRCVTFAEIVKRMRGA